MLQLIVDRLLYAVLGLDPGQKWARMLNFFLYDSVKIILLLFMMIALIGFLRTFLPPQKIKDWIIRKKSMGNIFAAIFGAVTPFCSCSSIPIFLSFLKAGIPLGVTFSFLITSPLVNEYLVVLMLGFFGWKITVLYIFSGMLLGIVVGLVLGRMKLERYLVSDILSDTQCFLEDHYPDIKTRMMFGIKEAAAIVRKLWIWILVGVGVGALIHNYVPKEVLEGAIQKTGIFSVPLAAGLGVPLYGSCAAIVPIAVVLFQKGIPLGTALAFMMATAALSLPEAVLLRRAMKLKLIAIFFGITTAGIIFTGYLFNYMQVLLL